jgi:EmrB/QacA subfamily drug resistance transporter
MTNVSTDQETGSDQGTARNRWLVLAVIGLAQLMLQFNSSIIVIALPSAQHDLAMPDNARAWVLGIYSLAFGGMLMAGGRVVDRVGRKRAIVGAMIGFVIASALGGSASTTWVLVVALALQGAFAAVQNPAQLATMSTSFTDPAVRTRAFAVFSFINLAGGMVGFVLSGIITQAIGWRWCLYVNVPLGIIAIIGAIFVLTEGTSGERKPFDVPGAVLVTASMFALVYGLTDAGKNGWGGGTTIGLLGGGVALLIVFVILQTRVRNPLMPMRIILDRNRGGANLVMFMVSMQILSMNLFFTYFAQSIKHFNQIATGIAILPLTIAILVVNTFVGKVGAKVRTRVWVVTGMLVTAVAFVWFSRISAADSYFTSFLPGLVIMGVGMACLVAPVYSTATAGVDPGDSGAAAGIVSTGRQMGAAIGLALFNTIAATTTSRSAAGSPDAQAHVDAIVHGYNVASAWAAGLLVVGAIIGGLLINAAKGASAGHGH